MFDWNNEDELNSGIQQIGRDEEDGPCSIGDLLSLLETARELAGIGYWHAVAEHAPDEFRRVFSGEPEEAAHRYLRVSQRIEATINRAIRRTRLSL